MILPQFELAEPTTVNSACDILRQNVKSRIIAGGTDLLVNMKKKTTSTNLVVSLSKIKALQKVSFSPRTGLSLGSMVRIAEIEASPVIKENYPILSKAAGRIGSPQVRNRATIGGNICSARPAGDTIGPLIACGATVQITGPDGVRDEPVESIFKGPGQTTIGTNEILTGIKLKKPVSHTGSSYIKYTIRNAMEIALVSVTTLVAIEDGVCKSARIVLGAVGPTFIKCPAAEEYLVGQKISPGIAEKAGQLAVDACHPITDVRASADYRRDLVMVLVQRSLQEAASEVKSS